MTYTITLSPETERVIAKRASRKGMTVSGYMAFLAEQAARKDVNVKSKLQKKSSLSDEEFEALLASMSLHTATPIPDNVDIRELAYEGVGE